MLFISHKIFILILNKLILHYINYQDIIIQIICYINYLKINIEFLTNKLIFS